jgi:hypothetical protein
MNNPAIEAALNRANDTAKLRKLALVAIDRAAREATTLDALREAIEQAIVEVATLEAQALLEAIEQAIVEVATLEAQAIVEVATLEAQALRK